MRRLTKFMGMLGVAASTQVGAQQMPSAPTRGVLDATTTSVSNALSIPAMQVDLGIAQLKLGAEHTSLQGTLLKAGVITGIGEDGALSVDVKVSSEVREILFQSGFNIAEGTLLKLSLAHLDQNIRFDFPSGSETVRVPQNTAGFTIRMTGSSFIRFCELTGYMTQSNSFSLGAKDYVIDSETFFQLWNDPRRVAGATTIGAEGKASIADPENPRLSLELAVGYAKRQVDTLLPTPSTSHITGGATLNVPLSSSMTGSVGYYQSPISKRYTAGVKHESGFQIQAFQEKPNTGRVNNGIQLGWQWSLGGGAPKGYNNAYVPRPADVKQFVGERPAYVPNMVDAQIDPTAQPTLRIQIDKTKFPEGTEFRTNGDIVVPLENPGVILSAINTSIKTGPNDVRTAFSVTENTILFQPRSINSNSLAAGENSLVVETTNYIVTFFVQKGSVEVTGVRIQKKEQDTVAEIKPLVSKNITSSGFDIQTSIKDPNGVRNIRCQLIKSSTGEKIGSPVTAVDGVCSFQSLAADTDYTVEVNSETGKKNTDGTITWEVTKTQTLDVRTLVAPNEAPVANNDSTSVQIGSQVDINPLGNDTDKEGATLSIVSYTQPAHGTLVKNGNIFTYTPVAGYVGEDSFTYYAYDGKTNSLTPATVNITVQPQPNQAPTAVADASTTPYQTPVVKDVVANDTDPNGDTLTILGTPTATNGTVSRSGNNVTFTPNAGYSGPATVNYTISDGNGGTANGIWNITVQPQPNQAPTAVADASTTPYQTPVVKDVVANDTDPNGDTLTILGTPTATNGTVSRSGNNVTFTPNAGYSGPATVNYTISDGNGGTANGIWNITVQPQPNQAPTAVADASTTPYQTPVVKDVVANDTDPNGDTLTILGTPTATNGTVSRSGNNVTFTPNAGYSGPATVNYTISDGNGGTANGIWNITVQPEVDLTPPSILSSSITGNDTILNPVTVQISYNEIPVFENITLMNSGFEILFEGTPSVSIDTATKKITIVYTTSGTKKDGSGGMGGLFEVYVSVKDASNNSTGSQLVGTIEQY